jgi:uncharacterized protein
MGKSVRRTLIIKVTSACNSSCVYCYSTNKREFLKKEVFDILLFRIEEYLKKNSDHRLHIIWHGGEPSLLPVEYWEEIAQKFLPLVRRYNITFAVQSNLIGDYRRIYKIWLNNGWRISTSLDGPYELHCLSRRISKEEFDSLMGNIRYVKSKQGKFGVICVVNRFNFRYPERLLNFFEKINVNVRFNKVVSTNEDVCISYREFYLFLKKIAQMWISNKDSLIVIQPILSDLLLFFGERKHTCDRNRYCFRYFLGIDPNGNIYPCNRLDDYSYFYGNIRDLSLEDAWRVGTEKNSNLLEKIRKSLKLSCVSCKVSLFCGYSCKSEFVFGEFSSSINEFSTKFCSAFKEYVESIENIIEEVGLKGLVVR